MYSDEENKNRNNAKLHSHSYSRQCINNYKQSPDISDNNLISNNNNNNRQLHLLTNIQTESDFKNLFPLNK